MPYLDDYTFLVDIIHLKAGSFTIRELAAILLAPHGPHSEHMIVFGRLTAILDYLIEGELNFKTLYFVGNGALISTVLLLYHIARRAGLSGGQLLPIALLLFQPQYYEITTTWAICALQHVPALFFAFLAFYLLAQPSTVLFSLSFPTALLATFSNGNGLAVLIAGFLLLLVSGNRSRLVVWLVFSILSFLLYQYCSHVGQPPAAAPVNITHPFRVLGGFFLMSGSMGILFTRSLVGLSLFGGLVTFVLATVAGTLLIRLTGFAHYLKRLPPALQTSLLKWSVPTRQMAALPLIACYFYLIITILGIAFARSLGWHYALLLPRFIWFTTVLIVVGYLLIMIWLRPIYRPSVSRVVLVFSLWFNLTSYWFNLGEVMTIHKSLVSDLHNWRENELLITMPPGETLYDTYYGLILRQAIEQGIYTLPIPDFEPLLASPSTPIDVYLNLVEKDSIFRYAERRHAGLTLARNALPLINPGAEGAYLLLRSTHHTFVWPVDQSAEKLAHFLSDGASALPDNIATIFADMLPEASYRVGTVYKLNGQWQAIYSPKIIKIDHAVYPTLGNLTKSFVGLHSPSSVSNH